MFTTPAQVAEEIEKLKVSCEANYADTDSLFKIKNDLQEQIKSHEEIHLEHEYKLKQFVNDIELT